MTIITRFAPSPTGYLHIGGARTALFNWLYAKNQGGKFLLRIEDTDKERSTDQAVDAIFNGLQWLGLNWDDDAVFQSKCIEDHKQVVKKLLDTGHAYYCYCSKAELEEMRQQAISQKRPYMYNGKWRDVPASKAPTGVEPVVRLKSPKDGETILNDMVQGRITVNNNEQDDMILMRADGTPTYMLAVVVDDYNMGVTDVIRGDDHLTNALRQKLIYDAMGWEAPRFAHIPLIHGNDGAKLSKRHGALGVETYRDMGYLPDAMCNYLLRLGWSHGDDEIITKDQAIEWFNIKNIGKSPSRFDFNKLDNVNAHYIKIMDNDALLELIEPIIVQKLGDDSKILTDIKKQRILQGMNSLKQRAKLITDLADSALFYILDQIIDFTDKARNSLDAGGKDILNKVLNILEKTDNWQYENIELVLKQFAVDEDIKIGKMMMPVRAAITGSHMSPSMFEAIAILGKNETLRRLKAAC